MTQTDSPTIEAHRALDRAFDYFNADLFAGSLTPVLITLNRKRGAHGYYWAQQFHSREDKDRLPEIAMNPESMSRPVRDVLSTLVHEMAHHWQQLYGTPGKAGYHNAEWGSKMDALGLTPTADGMPGGRRTGKRVTHWIIPGGAFDVSCADLLQSGFSLDWFACGGLSRPKKPDMSKVKHTCPSCDARAWAKIGSHLICGDCDAKMVAAVTTGEAVCLLAA